MISVDAAQRLCLELADTLSSERISLIEAAGRVLAEPAQAARAQPPFAASAMDGYAVPVAEIAPAMTFRVVGEAAAGHGWSGALGEGEAVRIFTGAPVPRGTRHVVIQEDVIRDGERITLRDTLGNGPNIRPQGADFNKNFTLHAPRILTPSDLALLAAMNLGTVSVTRRPTVALLATGDELVMPGTDPRNDQIVASNVFALKAMIDDVGGTATILPIAPDTPEGLRAAMQAMAGFDLGITIGGASVGDHDLVGRIGADLGLERSFYKIAMRPGKPLIAGRFGPGRAFVGLPGNPVSAIVCGHLFVLPMLRRMLGLVDVLPRPVLARLTTGLRGNGPRAHYMRATFHEAPDGREVAPAERQDSSLLTVLSEANCLLLRPAGDGPRIPGETVTILPL